MGKSEETRQYITEKAALIFNKQGYYGTSMSQLTKAINMTKGAIYGNFKDKDEIAIAAFDYNFDLISQEIIKAVSAEKNAGDKLIAFANYYLNNFSKLTGHGGCPLLNAAVDSDFVLPMLKERVAKAFEIWLDSVSKIIYSGIKRKQINKNVKPEQFASVFVSLIEGGVMISQATGSPIHLSRSIDHIIYMINAELRI